jgi:amidase
MTKILDEVGAFINQDCQISGNTFGPLKDLTFGLKDIFDVKGFKTGFGNPTWLSTHPEANQTNSAIQELINAGASLVGKTHCDELTYNLFGNNFHYGTPTNTASPLRMTGGSSNGSAAAMAAGLVDFSIGSDTGGSVRAPASFCGLYGIRPTHGRITLDNACGLAPSFDTLGWFTKSSTLLRIIGEVLFKDLPDKNSFPPKFVFLKEAFEVIDPELSTILKNNFLKFGQFEEVSIGNESLTEWADQFRVLQGSEIWTNLGPWVENHWEGISPPVKARFEIAKNLTIDQIRHAQKRWPEITAIINNLLQQNTILVLPTVAGPAPLLTAGLPELEAYRKQCFQLLSISGLCGTPQINIPIAKINGAPIGISLIGAQGSDMDLLHITESLTLQSM